MRRPEPDPTADARALVAQLREETAHSLNLERVLRELPAETRSALHALTRAARAARRRAQREAEALLAGEDEPAPPGRVWALLNG